MLTISPAATAAIQVLSLPGVPQRTGLRLSRDEDHAMVAAVGRPAPDDDVIVVTAEDAGAAVFVDRAAAALVDDQILDARMDATPAFCLKWRTRTAPPSATRPADRPRRRSSHAPRPLNRTSPCRTHESS